MPSPLGIVASSAQGVTFSPLDLPNLNGWWDASDATTITASSGSVSQWDDKSGNGYHLVQAVAASQPTTGTATQNSRNVLVFNGTNDTLRRTTPTDLGRNVSSMTAYIVARYSSLSSTSVAFAFATASAYTGRLAFQGSSAGKAEVGGRSLDSDSFVAASSSATLSTANHYLVTGVYDIANTDLYLYLGSSLQATNTSYQTATTTSNTASATLAVGASAAQTGFMNGQIAEILVYHAAHDATTRAQVWDYLNTKWGL